MYLNRVYISAKESTYCIVCRYEKLQSMYLCKVAKYAVQLLI